MMTGRGYTPVTASPLHSCARRFTPVFFRSRTVFERFLRTLVNAEVSS
jgi:hypothetical protein